MLIKSFLIVFFWAIAFSAWAQNQETRVIAWQSPPAKQAGFAAASNLPTFSEASYAADDGVPFYILTISNATVSSFEFTDQEFEPLTSQQARAVPKEGFKKQIEITLGTGVANRVPMSSISFQPFRANPQTGAPEKLVSFSYRYQTGTNNTQRRATGSTAGRRTYAANSVLSTGDWYKIAVTETGIYKIDRAALSAMGINVQGLNPKNLQVYGNGGAMLPQPNDAPRPDDLLQNAIWVQGEADNSFDAADYLLFYGQGPHIWTPTPNEDTPFKHTINLYSDTTYYYLHIGTTAGKRIQTQASVPGTHPIINSFTERMFHELNAKNLLASGREWYGEEFTPFSRERTFTYPVTDLVPNSSVRVGSSMVGTFMTNNGYTSLVKALTLKLNGIDLGQHEVSDIVINPSNFYPLIAIKNSKTFYATLNNLSFSNAFTLTYSFNPGNSSSASAHLNYFTIFTQRQLKLFGASTSFRSVESLQNPVSTFQVAGWPSGSAAKIWDITQPLAPQEQMYSVANGNASFSANSQTLREYVAFDGSNFLTPTFIRKVANQNLHRLSGANLDLIILTHPAFKAHAQRLATHRQTKTGLQVEVVLLPEVYEEFSSGKQDITAIRDFMKMLYDRSNKQGENQLKLLLFGDASYDYKNRVAANTNFIPVYESRESLNPVRTYSSDDYFGFMNEQEGEWSESGPTSSILHYLDVGIGRLPAKTSAEAQVMVDKIIRYESPQTFGNWRKRLVFLADDGDSNAHLNAAENLAENYIENLHPTYLPQKVYLDLYPQISVPNGKRSPETNKNLREAIEKGALVVNYTGHGNEVSLAAEQILTINEIKEWKNADRLTFLFTATCDFGKYDDPSRNSGAETALMLAGGGAVGLMTTTRPVYSNSNDAINQQFFKALFMPVANGSMPDLGFLITKSKNNSLNFGVNNRNFALLGDPSMTLAYPDLKIALHKINGKPFSPSTTDTLKALSKVTLEGGVTSKGGQAETSFQGQVHITVFDKRSLVTTFGDEKPEDKKNVLVRNNILYDGLATVRNGVFSTTFVVPKDINYQIGPGSIQLYAFSADTDASGAAAAPVGGADGSVAADNTPPEIQVFMNDESFVTGGITPKDGILLAHLYDDNGINTAGAGIGHEITAILDGKSSEPFLLNDFYTADVDSYQSGKVRYPLKDLAVGPHTLQLKAWDTHNNSSTVTIEFIVASSEKLALDHVFNIPNPFVSQTTFHFDHNRPGQELDILIQIFTVSGKLVKTLHGLSDGSAHFSDLTWDGRDDQNDILAKGVYIYKVNVRSHLDGENTSRFEKLVLLK